MIKEIWSSVRKACIWALAPIGMLVAFSCQDDMVAERQPVVSGDEISFTVGGDSVWSVMSRSQTSSVTHRQFLATIGKDSLFLYTMIEENTDQPFEKVKESRAASKTSESLKSSSFYLDAFYNGDTPFMNGTKVKWEDNAWKYSPLKYWPNNEGDRLDFYGYTDVPSAFAWGEKHESFTYTLPDPQTNDADATRQQDLIFAQALNQTKQIAGGAVQLKFYHALSAVLFKVGALPSDITLKDLTITLENVKDKGTCTITNNNNVLSFAWNNDDASLKNYSQAFTSTLEGGYAKDNDISTEVSETAFMMVPHTFDTKAQLNIYFKINDVEYSFDHPLIIGDSKAWEANKKYTYVISIEEYVEVKVDDVCTPTVKSDVKIQNTGLSDAYMRAAIVGYWVNESGDIVASWNDDVIELSEDAGDKENMKGIFEGLCGNSWEKRNDGFYYYKNLVSPGGYTTNLFNSYKLTETQPFVGATLELNIIVQAVKKEEFEGTNKPWKL